MSADEEKEEDIASVMGFSGFGRKTAIKFDVEKLFEQTRRTAREYSQQASVKQSLQAATGREDSDGVPGDGVRGGRCEGVEEEEDSSDSEVVGPPLPPGYQSASGREEDEDSGEEEGEGEGNGEDYDKKYPISHEVTLEHGSKPVSALALDPSGARVATGGYDYEVKFWDFAGMDSSLHSFRTVHPCESHQMCSLQYRNTGDCILVAAGNTQHCMVV